MDRPLRNPSQGKCDLGAGRGICKEGREDAQVGVEWPRCCPINVFREGIHKVTRCFCMVRFDAVTTVQEFLWTLQFNHWEQCGLSVLALGFWSQIIILSLDLLRSELSSTVRFLGSFSGISPEW